VVVVVVGEVGGAGVALEEFAVEVLLEEVVLEESIEELAGPPLVDTFTG
jgi:hypothetical protein